jgi:hypothetical protein
MEMWMTRFMILLVVSGTWVCIRPVFAADKTAGLLSGPDLLSLAGGKVTEGMSSASAGSILYPDQILGVLIAKNASVSDDRVAQWSKAYRFVVIPLALAIQANPGLRPRSVVINAAFRNQGDASKQPIIIDVFPTTGFKPGPLTAEASVGVGADLKFTGAAPASADASLKGALSYKYTPSFANVQSGYSSTGCFWQFTATQDQQPVGSLPLKLTVAIPRSFKAPSIALTFDVLASLGGSWFGDDVRASFISEVLLPQAN